MYRLSKRFYLYIGIIPPEHCYGYIVNTARALLWLHRPAWGLGGVAPATLLTTQMGVQAVIHLVGRIRHGVCQ
ncbi:MbcA/ParS/Xre antitoxin family protein [Aeromonas sp.]|uniref:MbcA/ParS/Xre antitoxin family protein n=1 Tax=Aeromonas sp. TaxID=647 RepID=UPI002586DEDB|nr:MbcA/ParS/Xre antitoxin family protein [Aeromonas sp.]MCX7132108.1 MbcA/ParS/Xre antitoxin family protein [Aeromonas sp.]